MQKTKLAKCPNCLPDCAGAYFDREMKDYPVDGPPVYQWKCRNCNHTMPYTPIKPKPETETASQKEVIALLTALCWTLEIKWHGRNIWVVGRKDRGSPVLNLFNGDSFYGTIGVRGKFRLTLHRLGGDKVLTDRIDLNVYLK